MQDTLKRLRKVREDVPATLAAWAGELGISEGQLSRIERGLVESMDVRLAAGIERLYGVSIYDLAGVEAPTESRAAAPVEA